MFDDKVQGQGGQTPANLPFVDEPQDMFAKTDSAASPPASVSPIASSSETPQSALSAGVLRPKEPVAAPVTQAMPVAPGSDTADIPAVPPVSPPAVSPPSAMQSRVPSLATDIPDVPKGDYALKGPSLSRGIMTVIVLIVVFLIIGGGAWWIYAAFIKDQSKTPSVNEVPQELPASEEELNTGDPADLPPLEDGTLEEETPIDTDDLLLFGEPIDTDGDGLDDVREEDIGTDPRNWDSDDDGLSDGDEVIIWKTDPNNPDSDGDSYEDGAEVKSGYNPAGPGKFFEQPTSSGGVPDAAVSARMTEEELEKHMGALREAVGDIGTCSEAQYELVRTLVLEQLKAQEEAGEYVIDDATYTDPVVVQMIQTQLAPFGCLDT